MASIETRKSRGETVYRARVRVTGAPVITKTFPSKTLAKDWARKMELEIKEDVFMPTMKAQRRTLGELMDRYITDKLNHYETPQKTTKNQLEQWRKLLGNYNLSAITPERILWAINEIEKIPTPGGHVKSAGTLNRYLGVLSPVLTFGVKELGWIKSNPAFNVSRRPEPNGRVRWLSDEERERLLAEVKKAKSPYLYPVVILGISTGARRGEIMGLKWQDIDLKAGWANLNKTKNKDRRGIPLTGLALEIMRELHKKRRCETWVFPNEDHSGPFDIRSGWEHAKQRAKLENFRFHDLRHTCASYLIMNGASLGEIADVLGHKDPRMSRRYAHISDQHKASVVANMNKKIFG